MARVKQQVFSTGNRIFGGQLRITNFLSKILKFLKARVITKNYKSDKGN